MKIHPKIDLVNVESCVWVTLTAFGVLVVMGINVLTALLIVVGGIVAIIVLLKIVDMIIKLINWIYWKIWPEG